MKRTALVSGVLALVLGLTACGGGQSAPSGPTLFGDAQELVRVASSKTGEAQSAKFTMTMSMAGEEITGSGEGRFTSPGSVMAMTMNVGGESMEMRLVDKVVYFKVPPQAQSRTGGKPWAKLAEGSEAAKALGSSIEQAEANNPAETFDQVQKAGTITRSEVTTLDGKQVSHYWVTIDLGKSGADFGLTGLSPEVLEQLKSQNVTFPLELWLDSGQLPVQITQDLGPVMKAVGAPAEAQNATATMKYSDWGTPVTVQAPPADQVGELHLS